MSQATKNVPGMGPYGAQCRRGRAIKLFLPPNQKINKQKSSPPASAVKRYISLKLKDQIWVRDQGMCQFKNKNTGKVCGSQAALQIDHVHPYAWGGEHREANLRLLCARHNRYRAEKILGDRAN